MQLPASCLLLLLCLGGVRSIAQTGALTPVEPPTNERAGPFTAVDQMPEYPGGEAALDAYFTEHLEYPMKEKEEGKQGKVWLRFTVDSLGQARDISIISGPALAMNREAQRVAMEMPRWIPGKQAGRNVAVLMTFPVAFRLPPASKR